MQSQPNTPKSPMKKHFRSLEEIFDVEEPVVFVEKKEEII